MTSLPAAAAARLKTRPAATDRPAGSARFDLAMSLLMGWMITGAYLDAWAHSHIGEDLDPFFTPWHGVLYSGFFAAIALLGGTFLRNLLRGYRWQHAVPDGYNLSLIAGALFFLGGLGDMLWHLAFGLELSIEGTLSPTHQILQVSTILLISGPLRAAWKRPEALAGWSTSAHIVAALAVLYAGFSIMTTILHPFVQPWSTADYAAPAGSWQAWEGFQIAGLAGVISQTLILMGLILFAIRRWGTRLPLGTFTLMTTLTALGITLINDQQRLIPALALAGLAADGLLRWLRPSAERLGAVRVFSALVPLILFGAYFLILLLTDSIWWSVHTAAGALTAAGVSGLLIGTLIFPPRLPDELTNR